MPIIKGIGINMSNTKFKVANFTTGAFIIVESNKKAESFFIIRSGSVQIITETTIPGEEANQVLKQGDFFGVVSAMSGHPHIETAQALTDVSIIIVENQQFESLIKKNTPIAMKIIRYFSKQLRDIDRAVSKLSLQTATQEDGEEIFRIAEYYYSQREMKSAIYAYQTYIALNSQGENVLQAKVRLQGMGASYEKPELPGQSLNRQFPDGSTIMIEYEPGSELYIIQGGKVKISKVINEKEVLLATLKPGDIFGEMAILENKPRSATATAVGDINALVINKANFETMVVSQPQLAVRLITILSDRIWLEFRRLANHLISDPMARVYDMLLTLVLKKKLSLGSKSSHIFDVTINDLMDMLGYSKEKAKTCTNALRADKNFSITGDKILCQSLGELEKVVSYNRKKVEIEKKRQAASVF